MVTRPDAAGQRVDNFVASVNWRWVPPSSSGCLQKDDRETENKSCNKIIAMLL